MKPCMVPVLEQFEYQISSFLIIAGQPIKTADSPGYSKQPEEKDCSHARMLAHSHTCRNHLNAIPVHSVCHLPWTCSQGGPALLATEQGTLMLWSLGSLSHNSGLLDEHYVYGDQNV